MAGFLLLAASAVLLTAGAELFAEHASAAARRLGVTALAIGLVLAGAEPEELVTAVIASAGHHPGIAAGDAVGANVTMLTLVLGLAALARPFRLTRRVRGYALAASAVGLAAAAALAGGGIGRLGGGLLTAAYLATVAVIWWREKAPPAFGEAADLHEHTGDTAEEAQDRAAGQAGRDNSPAAAPPDRRDARAVLLVLAGVAGMAAGGRLAVSGAERVVSALGLRESVVGLIFVALATTAELFALVWAALRRDVAELALAGVLGSAIYNSTATLGIAALVRPLTVTGIGGQAWLAAALPAALVAWSLAAGRIGRLAGLLLLAAYGAFLTITIP